MSTREFQLATALYWRLRRRDPEGAAMASTLRLAELQRARAAGVPEREIERIDEVAREREAMAAKGRCA